MDVQTYLFFDGCCEEAIQFYAEVFGAELGFLMRFSEAPAELRFPGGDEKIFHATVKFGDTPINMNDVQPSEAKPFGGFALLVHVDSVEEIDRAFELLQADGEVHVPLTPTPWAARYCVVKDRFGITWKLQVN